MRRTVGLHIRLETTISQVAEKALGMGVRSFQTFASIQHGGYHRLSAEDKRTFLKLRPQFDTLYLHASYWINLGQPHNNPHLFERELALARELEFDYVTLHPGACAPGCKPAEGIDLIARQLNMALAKHRRTHILLENTAHAGRSIGGDIGQLHTIFQKLDYPDRVHFCIDTAHAHVFGYDLNTAETRQTFVEIVDSQLGIDKLKLIHFNDVQHDCGSHIDQHATPGTGKIGREALTNIMHHPKFRHIPLLLELPLLSEENELEIITDIAQWKE